MLMSFLWIAGVYGVSVGLVHLVHASVSGAARNARQYVLITRNNQAHIEWYIRSLLLYSWVHGKNISIHVLDEGSDDQTLDIIAKITANCHANISLLKDASELEQLMTSHANGEVVCLSLKRMDDHRKVPLFR